MDRQAERRLASLKVWRTGRAKDLAMDPGVLAPNAVLEAVAWRDPLADADLEDLPELKSWFRREFGAEVIRASLDTEPESDPPKRRRRGGRRNPGKAEP